MTNTNEQIFAYPSQTRVFDHSLNLPPPFIKLVPWSKPWYLEFHPAIWHFNARGNYKNIKIKTPHKQRSADPKKKKTKKEMRKYCAANATQRTDNDN